MLNNTHVFVHASRFVVRSYLSVQTFGYRHLSIWKSSNPKIKGLPFVLTKEEAVDRMIKSIGFFEKSISIGNTLMPISHAYHGVMKQIYVPVSAMCVTNIETKYSATFTTHRRVHYYDHANKKNSSYEVADYHHVDGRTNKHSHSFGTKKLQLYAGYEYPHDYINEICKISTTNYANDLCYLTEKDFVDEEKKYIKIEPPEQNYDYSYSKLLEKLREIETKIASTDVENKYNRFNCNINYLDYDLTKCDVKMDRWFVPVYVYEYKNPNGIIMYKFVNGYTGKVSGHKIFNGRNVALVTWGCCTSLMCFGGEFIILHLGEIMTAITLGSVFVGFVSQYSHYVTPHFDIYEKDVDKKANDGYKRSDVQRKFVELIGKYNRDWAGKFSKSVGTDDEQLKFKKSKSKSTSGTNSNKNQQSTSTSAKHHDLKVITWCKIMGIEPEKIQTMNRQNLREKYYEQMKIFHPDKWNGDQSVANEKSKSINEAYEGLSKYVKL